MTMRLDLAMRSADIRWPDHFDPQRADLFAHNALAIAAPCERVWRHIIDVARWPDWYPNAKAVRLLSGDTVLGAGSTWRWTTFGLAIESRVHQYEPPTRLGWFGYAPDAQPSFCHMWYLTPQGNSCFVAMDEVGIGTDSAHLRETDEGLMHRGHDLWLATLKWVAESSDQ